MQQIVIEKELVEKLITLSGEVQLCDADGQVLGVFTRRLGQRPVGDYDLDPPLSIAEIEEFRKVRTGKPLEEILRKHGL